MPFHFVILHKQKHQYLWEVLSDIFLVFFFSSSQFALGFNAMNKSITKKMKQTLTLLPVIF